MDYEKGDNCSPQLGEGELVTSRVGFIDVLLPCLG